MGWEATEKTSYGLEPFVFDKGEVKTQAELVSEAQSKIHNDKVLKQTLKARKDEIVAILQGCLDKVNDQLERGEDICRKAHFPLLHPFNFEDLEALAQHDFTVDIHADVVDQIMKELVGEFLKIVWTNVAVEDVSKARMLERYNEALVGRMETLEYHLIDRSRQLSNCRFAYFLEITHLRNQVYIQGIEGEKFDPVEAYFFDPTDYLEEELRLQLNDKITLSVKVYDKKLREANHRIEDLEMQLEAAGGAWRSDKKKRDKLASAVEQIVVDHKPKRVLDELYKQQEREVTAWAMEWASKNGYSQDPLAAEGEDLTDLRNSKLESLRLGEELQNLNEAMAARQQELEDEKLARQKLEAELDKLKALRSEQERNGLNPDERRTSVPMADVSEEELQALRTQLAHGKLETEKALQRTHAAERELASEAEAKEASRRALEKLQLQYDKLLAEERKRVEKAEAEMLSGRQSSMVITAPGLQVASAKNRRSSSHQSNGSGEDDAKGALDKELVADYGAAKGVLEDMYKQYRDIRSAGRPSHFGNLGSIAGVGLGGQQSDGSGDAGWTYDAEALASMESRRGQLTSLLENVPIEDDLQDIDVEGEAGLVEYVTWLKALLDKKDALLRGVEASTLDLAEEVVRQTALVDEQRRRADDAESEHARLFAAVASAEAALAAARGEAGDSAAKNSGATLAEDAARKKTVFGQSSGEPVANPWGGFDSAAQTAITGAWDGGFYLLEFPPSDDQLALEVELEDLNACAMSSYETAISQVRSCQRPPLGYGSGFCPRSAFLRLFQGIKNRIARMDEILEMIEKLKRADMLRMMHGVHLLMESTLPNDDGPLRDAIFGRGISESALITAKSGPELMALSEKWCSQVSRVVDILLKGTTDIELGVHLDRRTFAVGAAAGGMGGGAGGGLAARERIDFSPIRPPVWRGVLDPEDDVRELQGLSTAVYLSPRSRAREKELTLEGEEIPLYNLDGINYGMRGFDSKNGPYIVVGGRLVPRGGVEMMTPHGYLPPPSSLQEASAGTAESQYDLLVKASSWRPEPTECPARGRPRSAALWRSPSPKILETSMYEDDSTGKNDLLSGSFGMTAASLGTTAASAGEMHRSDSAGSQVEKGRSPSPMEDCEDVGLDDSAAKVIARLRPIRGGVAAMNTVQPSFDVEEPQAEPAPRNQRPQSGSMAGRALRTCEKRDREVERARRQMCEATAGSCGPVPTFVMDQIAEQKAPRNAGGRHTKADVRSGPGPKPLRRGASAGALRGSFTEASVTPASASSGILSGVMAGKAPATMVRPGTAPRGRQVGTSSATGSLTEKMSGLRPGTAPGSRGPSAGAQMRPSSSPMVRTAADGGAPSKPLVRITSMPAVKASGSANSDQQRG